MKRFLSIILCVLLAACCSGCGNKLELDQTELSMTVGDTAQLSAGKATKVHWESSDDTIASVSGGQVNAKKAGEAFITASLENGEQQSCKVTVADKLITEVKISADHLRLQIGSTIQLTATYSPADASKTGLRWSSKDSSIAEVDEQGYVKGVSAGVTDILCTSENGIEGSCTITVDQMTEPPTQAPTQAPTVSPTDATTAPTSAASEQSDSGSSGTGGFIFPDSSTRYLTADEVGARLRSMSGSPVSDSFAQDAINEIYARNGYVFRSGTLNAYYRSQSWYKPDPTFGAADLNPCEQYNVGILSSY